MKERKENNSSKARTYSFFAVALLLMGAGLFGSFYTLMGGMNTSKLVGSTSCTYANNANIGCPSPYKMDRSGNYGGKCYVTANSTSIGCPSPYKMDRSGNYGGKCYVTAKYNKKTGDCPHGYTPSKIEGVCYKSAAVEYKCPKDYTPSRVEGVCYKSAAVEYKCPKGYKPDSNGRCAKCKSYKTVTTKKKTTTPTTTAKRYYQTTTTSKTTTKAALKTLKLTCKQGNQTLKEGSTVTVYRPITCTVNTNGVRFKATGKKAVTLTESKKVYDFKYTKGKDSATIKVSKNGYKTKTIKFKVTENMKITSNSKKAFKIYCPSKVRVGDKFVCYVSEEYRGATITTKFNDEKEVVAAKNTKILYLKYDKPGTLKVSAKYGKNTLDRTIKIVDSETASKTKVHLNCSRTEVNSNEKFYCFSTIDGVQIKMDSKCKLNSGFNSTMTTSFANNTRKYANYFSCSKGDDTIVTVTATKDGYVSNSRTINIK